MKRLVVGLSGGVDSAVAAALLQQQGFELTGVMLRLTGRETVDDAAAVCRVLSIPHHVLDLTTRFADEVIAPFVACFRGGQTPNPCVTCNKAIKFGALLDWALDNDFDGVATGHYVGTVQRNGRTLLVPAADCSKDQSYFLCLLSQHQLSHAFFPLAGYDKPTVRRLAAQLGLPVAQKKDSQDICFIPDGDCAGFLADRLPPQPGDIIDSATGTVAGKHAGLYHYTIGQRKNLGALGKKAYVCRLDAATNTVYAGDNEALFSTALTARAANWLLGDAPAQLLAVTAKIRSTAAAVSATATALPNGRLQLTFAAPVRAVTPGQAVALYQDNALVAGGIIE